MSITLQGHFFYKQKLYNQKNLYLGNLSRKEIIKIKKKKNFMVDYINMKKIQDQAHIPFEFQLLRWTWIQLICFCVKDCYLLLNTINPLSPGGVVGPKDPQFSISLNALKYVFKSG